MKVSAWYPIVFIVLFLGVAHARLPLRSTRTVHAHIRFLACSDPIAVTTLGVNKRTCHAEVRDGGRTVQARVVYEWLSYQTALPSALLNAGLLHNFDAVRNSDCDRTADFDQVVPLDGVTPTISNFQPLPCYVIGPDGYRSTRTITGQRFRLYEH